MAINSATIEAERTSSSEPTRVPARALIAIAITVVVAIVTLVAYGQSSNEEFMRPTQQPATQSRDDIVQDLVDRGLVPHQTLQPVPQSRDEIVQDLVDRGLVPDGTPND